MRLEREKENKKRQNCRPSLSQALEAADFADVRPLFAPLMHTVLLNSNKTWSFVVDEKDGVLLLMKKVRNLNEQFHLQMCLVYSSSEFYNTTDRIIVLMQVFPLLSLLVVF